MKSMRKCFSKVFAICMLIYTVCPIMAEPAGPEDSFLLRIWNQTDLEISYLRFDYFLGDMQQGYVLCCPNEGENFYRFEVSEEGLYSLETGKELEDFRVECSYCVSELSPEEAILSAMMGKDMGEIWFQTLEIQPVFGEEYDYLFTENGDGGYLIQPAEAESYEDNFGVSYVFEDGLYIVDGVGTFRYRKILTGRTPGAVCDSKYIILTNNPEINFDMADKSLYSSNLNDQLTDTVFIGMHTIDESLQNTGDE